VGHSQITRLFDFINPAAIALWNLRWQVKGFCDTYSSDHDVLKSRFALGSGLRGGELYRACVSTSWEEQLEEFANIVLVNVIATFEDFTQGIAALGGFPTEVAESLQFPIKVPPQQKNGHDWAFAQFGPSVPELRGVFYMRHGTKRYAGPNLNNLLICYRYFKSLRNMLAHNGGRATPQMVNAYTAFASVATKTALGLDEVPLHHPVTLGGRVKVELRGVTGLCNVILRIMTTYDAELSDRQVALNEVNARTATLNSRLRMPPSEPSKRAERIQGLLHAGSLPTAVATPALIDHLKVTGKIPAFW